jgi:hypothetical protein
MKTKEPSPDAMANTHTPNPLDGRVWVGIRVVFYIRVDKKLWRKIKCPLGWRKRMAAGGRKVWFITNNRHAICRATPEWQEEMCAKLLLCQEKPQPRS